MSKQSVRIVKVKKVSRVSSPQNQNHELKDSLKEKANLESNKVEDQFYPNAIHCLLTLYNDFYKEFDDCYPSELVKRDIWGQIENKMQECLFEFNKKQIKDKFLQLRQQYFNVTSSNDANQFEYFRHLHDLYNDPFIEELAKNQQFSGSPKIYKDEILFKEDFEFNDYLIKEENINVDIKTNDSLSPEEHITVPDYSSSITNDDHKNERRSNIIFLERKKPRLEESSNQYLSEATKVIESIQEKSESACFSQMPAEVIKSQVDSNDMSLAQFNMEQERRHQEFMQKMQELLDVQMKLFNELNKMTILL